MNLETRVGHLHWKRCNWVKHAAKNPKYFLEENRVAESGKTLEGGLVGWLIFNCLTGFVSNENKDIWEECLRKANVTKPILLL